MLVERAVKLLKFSVHRISEEKLSQVAASLTFTTVLSLVPLLAVILALFTAFPAFTELKNALDDFLANSLLPAAVASTIMDYINQFVANATEFKALGGVFLGFAAVSMVMTVDQVMNDIWRVHRLRSWPQRIIVYWTVLSLGPIIGGVSLWLTSNLVRESTGWLADLPWIASILLLVISLIATTLVFSAVFMVVPNCYVNWRDALVGGGTVAVILQLFRSLFGYYIASNVTYSSLYGAFAVIPIFLMWLYLSWVVILFGAVVTASMPQIRMGRWEVKRVAGAQFTDAILILKLLIQQRSQLAVGLTTTSLSMQLKINTEEVLEVLDILADLNYVAKINEGAREQWVILCDPAQTKLKPIVDKLLLDGRYIDTHDHRKIVDSIVALWTNNPDVSLLDVVNY